MAKFNAGTAVEALEYDFTEYVPGCEGIIPEPSTEQIEQYFERAREVAKEVIGLRDKMQKVSGDNVEEMSEEEISAIVTDLESVNVSDMQNKMIALIADLCSQQPSAEHILALPFRVRQEFVKWVGAQFRSGQ